LGRSTKSAGGSGGLLPAFVLQDSDQRCLMFRQIEVVELAEPARQFAEVAKARTLDGADRLALLAGQPNLTPNDRTFERRFGDDEDEMLEGLGFQRIFDLAPPVAPAFERDDVLPDREVFFLRHFSQVGSECRAVLARVRNKSPAWMLAKHGLSQLSSMGRYFRQLVWLH
jgi:hypothetical protein